MSNDLALSHLFCESHPSDAASLLVRLPPEYVAGFMSSLSLAQGILLIQHMPTAYASQLLSYFESDFSARLLSHADFATAARLLRTFNVRDRESLMSHMDTPQAAQLSRILNYAPGSIGNLVEIPALTALSDWNVKYAQREVKKILNRSLFDFPVVDDNHHFLGLVTVHSLLIAKEHVRLEELCTGKDLALPAYTTIVSVINHPLWTNHLSLPVIDRGGIFMGLLFNAALKDQTSGSFGVNSQDVLAPVMAIAELYWAATSSVIETFGNKMASQHKSN